MKTKSNELREQAAAKFKEADEYLKGLGKEDWNDLSPEEQEKFQSIMNEAKDLDEAYAKAAEADGPLESLGERMAFYHAKATGRQVAFQPVERPEAPKTLGQLFVESDTYKNLVESGHLTSPNSKFESKRVQDELNRWARKAATDLIDTVSGGPAAALVRPEYAATLPLPAHELVVRDLFAQGTIGSDLLIYAQQTARDSGAAAVSQATAVDGVGAAGGVKPQSSVAFEEANAPVKNVATWMAATRQSLQDAGVLSALIDNQGRLMLDLYVDDQLLNGNGTGPNISGIRDQAIQTLNLAADNADNLDGVRTARRLIKTGLSRASADSIVLNPVDSEYFDLLKDGQGLYRGGNPIGNFNFDQTIWRLRRVESEAMPEGRALVGAFSFGASVLARTPMQVYTTDSHADFFIRNLVVVLFEERLAFPVWWPSAFCELVLTDWEDGSGS